MERYAGKETKEDRLVRKLVERITEGDEVLISRIFQTLQIDGETHPTTDQVRQFIEERRRERRNVRKPNRE